MVLTQLWDVLNIAIVKNDDDVTVSRGDDDGVYMTVGYV